jgi:nicotinamidase-related amidase
MKDTFTIEELNEIYSSKGYRRRLGFGAKPAILVIDFIRGFTGGETPLSCDLTAELQQTLKILTSARKSQIPVIFTSISYRPDLADAGLWWKKLPLESLIEGTGADEIDPILQRQPDEVIVSKKYASGFFGTDLVSLLNAQGVDTIIVTGCSTSGCVRATAVDGISYGLRVMVVEDAVGDRAELTHKVTLADIEAKYGDVVSTDEVLEYLASI